MRDGGGRGSDAVTGDAATEVEEGSAKVYTDLGRQDADLLRGQFRGVSEVKMLHNPTWAGAGGSFYLTRTEGSRAMFLYGWDNTQSAWGPDHAKAHRFASAPLALDMAVRCGGPNEGDSPITIAED